MKFQTRSLKLMPSVESLARPLPFEYTDECFDYSKTHDSMIASNVSVSYATNLSSVKTVSAASTVMTPIVVTSTEGEHPQQQSLADCFVKPPVSSMTESTVSLSPMPTTAIAQQMSVV